MTKHREAAARATAAIIDITSRGAALQAAVLRDASQIEIEEMRRQAHDVLDAYLDQTMIAAAEVRTILKG